MRPVVLVVLDGWGIADPAPGNAISLAKLPNYTQMWNSFPHTTLSASGEAVGLPRGEAGNTETGHLNLGAGRIIYQDLPRINMAIADGSFYKKPALLRAVDHVRQTGGKLHIAGLVGSGGVHSNIEHLFALLHLSKEQNLSRVFLHLFTDGRDSLPTSARVFIDQVKQEIVDLGVGQIATISGRYYAMDRDRRWDRTEKAYKAMVEGIGVTARSIDDVVNYAYGRHITDEFIEPTVICGSDGKPLATVSPGDAIIFFNFRVDRLRQLTKAFVYEDFEQGVKSKESFDPYAIKYYKKHIADQKIHEPFHRGPKIQNLYVVTMTEYEQGLPVDGIVFPTLKVKDTLGEILANHGLRQLRASESEKERFVTYYFSGQHQEKFSGEDWFITPSPKVATYDLAPEMSANALTEGLIAQLKSRKYQFILVNYPNPDMVGHTGLIPPAIKACEIIDVQLGKLVNEIKQQNGYCIVTADHGNVEEMLARQTGQINTEHSTNPVLFIAIANEWQDQAVELSTGILADVAPTILKFMNIPVPKLMTGRYLMR